MSVSGIATQNFQEATMFFQSLVSLTLFAPYARSCSAYTLSSTRRLVLVCTVYVCLRVFFLRFDFSYASPWVRSHRFFSILRIMYFPSLSLSHERARARALVRSPDRLRHMLECQDLLRICLCVYFFLFLFYLFRFTSNWFVSTISGHSCALCAAYVHLYTNKRFCAIEREQK